MFFTAIGLEGSWEEKTKTFVQRGKVDKDWAFDLIVRFMTHQKKRCGDKQITAGTLRNYYKPIKILCESNDIVLNWKRISRGFQSSEIMLRIEHLPLKTLEN